MSEVAAGAFPAGPFASGPKHVTSSAKAVTVRVIMSLVMFLTGTYVGVDWSAYFAGFHNPYSAPAGYARTILCAVMVWITRSNRISTRDGRLLSLAFALALVADWFLTLKEEMLPGTAVYLAVHALLIIRHAQGLLDALLPLRRARTVRVLILTAIPAYGIAALLLHRFAPVLAKNHHLGLDAFYLGVLATSMWTAWGTLFRDFYDKRNAWYIALGMTSFFFCDVSVGLAAAMKGEKMGLVLDNLVGFFYTPALVMLALSGYRWVAPGAPTSER